MQHDAIPNVLVPLSSTFIIRRDNTQSNGANATGEEDKKPARQAHGPDTCGITFDVPNEMHNIQQTVRGPGIGASLWAAAISMPAADHQ
nr:uncharacterized protein CTRU02_05210 [Colletotrichum truncatum]KAF6794378.1 hypothetical protein CTRU02_05210 [Colletotrichum truncatum]